VAGVAISAMAFMSRTKEAITLKKKRTEGRSGVDRVGETDKANAAIGQASSENPGGPSRVAAENGSYWGVSRIGVVSNARSPGSIAIGRL